MDIFHSRRDKIAHSIDKQIKLVIVLVICIVLAVFVLIWAQTESPIYRPLIQDMRLVNSVKIADVLDQEEIEYYSDIKNHMLYVNQSKSELARVALAKVGFVIEYPEISKHNDLNKAYDEFMKLQKEKAANVKIWEQPSFLRLVKLVMGALVIIILIFAVIRPLLRHLILDEDDV